MSKHHTLVILFSLCISLLHAQKFITAYNKGNYEKALSLAEKGIDDDPKNLDAYLYKSLSYMHLATDDETKAEYGFGIESSITTLRFLNNKDKQKTYLPAHQKQVDSIIQTASDYAFELYSANKLSRVEKMLDKLLELSPQPEHYFLRGKLLQEQGKDFEAIKAFNTASAKIYLDYKKGVTPAPYLHEAFIALANSLANDYDFSSACIIYCRALDIFKLQEVEDACYQFMSVQESNLHDFSSDPEMNNYLHYADSILTFVSDPAPFIELKWFVIQKFYEGLVNDERYDTADSLMTVNGCDVSTGRDFILFRILNQTKVIYTLQQRNLTNAKNELLIYLKLLNCDAPNSSNEQVFVEMIDSLMKKNKFVDASELIYNLKLVSQNKSMLTQVEDRLYQTLNKMPDSIIATVDLYEIFHYFPDNKNLKKLQQNSAVAIIDKYIHDKKFTEAGEMLRNQIQLYPKDASLRSLQKIWMIEDYKTNYLGSELLNTDLGWTGNYDECKPGVIAAIANQKLIQRLNYVRRLAGLPDQCTLREEWNLKCQAAALMMGANGQLSHSPSADWKCYSKEGAAGAGNSNLSLGASDVDALMGQLDDGGIASVGHRRWILCPYRKVYGHGSNGYSMALWALGGKDANYPEEKTKKFETQFVAWPPEGYVPANMATQYWSFALENCDFSKTTVEMKSANQFIECTILEQEFGYGQNTLVWIPTDMTTFFTAEVSYTVTLRNVIVTDYPENGDDPISVSKNFTYMVTFVPISAW